MQKPWRSYTIWQFLSNSGAAGEADVEELLPEPEREGGVQGLRAGLRVPLSQAHLRCPESRPVKQN